MNIGNSSDNQSTLIAIAAGILVFSILGSWAANFDPAADGFGKNWQSFSHVEFDGTTIRGQIEEVVTSAQKLQADGAYVVLWLGASQLHTISGARDNDVIAVHHANRLSADSGSNRRYVQLSYGNANLYELLAAYIRVRQSGFKPNELVLAITYDDFRETGVRDQLKLAETDDLAVLNASAIDYLIEQTSIVAAPEASPVERNATAGTPQEKLEEKLLHSIEEYWPAYSFRQQLKGKLEIAWKEKITRMVLGSERRNSVVVASELLDENLSALDAIRIISDEDNTKLTLYRQPLLKKTDFSYYVLADYSHFAETLSGYSRQFGLNYRDFDSLVPNEFYGITNSGLPDYFHFNGKGHLILAESIDVWLAESNR